MMQIYCSVTLIFRKNLLLIAFIMQLITLSKLSLIRTFILLSHSPTLAAAEDGLAPCSILTTLSQDKVSYPGTNSYTDSIDSYFSQEARLRPSCVVRPTSVSDVSLIVNKMVGLRQNNSDSSAFAIRSGGHTLLAGAANIIIDLQSINNISTNLNETITAVGAGSIWNDIYATVTPMNFTALGARVAGRQLYPPSKY